MAAVSRIGFVRQYSDGIAVCHRGLCLAIDWARAEAATLILLEPILNPIWAYLIDPVRQRPTIWLVIGGLCVIGALADRYWPTGGEREPKTRQLEVSNRLTSLDAYRGFIMMTMASGRLGLMTISRKMDPPSPLWNFLGYRVRPCRVGRSAAFPGISSSRHSCLWSAWPCPSSG
jgi:hypothetical protein